MGVIYPSWFIRINGIERGEDGRRVRRGDYRPPHRYIRNTSTRGTAPIEHPLNAGRRRQTSQKARNSPRTWVGQKKKEKQRQKNRDGTCTSGRELERRKGFHTLGSPFAGGDCGWQRGSFGATEERAATGVWKAKRRDSRTVDRCRPALTSPRGLSAHPLGGCGGCGGWELRLGLRSDRRERTGVGGVNTA